MTSAGYSGGANETRGRVHPEPADRLRDPFELDRYRLLSCASFRRLQYKTQVFVYDENDHFRTRLTHTLEVAEIARRLAVALGLNERLAEVIALAHDLGHPPYGHAGESALRQLMADHGGFEHNVQSLRVVDFLEHPFPAFRGLNLTFETREGLVKHASRYDTPDAAAAGWDVGDLLAAGPYPTLESQAASLADRIAYDGHDLEDGLGAGLITEADLASTRLWTRSAAPVREKFPHLSIAAIRRPILAALQDTLLDDAIGESGRRLRDSGVRTVDDVRHAPSELIALSSEGAALADELESLLSARVYGHYRVVRMDAKAGRFLERLFSEYVRTPALLPPRYFSRLEAQGCDRVVCDYLAGMTDRFCQDEYRRLFEPRERI